MTKDEFKAAYAIAKSGVTLTDEDTEIFDGFGLPDFKPVAVTLRQVARLIRWQAFRLNGSIDAEALDEVATMGRKRFVIVG